MSKYKKRIIWGIIIIAVAAGGYYFLRPKAPKTVYTTADVQKGDLVQTVSVTGELVPINQAELSFKATGRVLNLKVDVGDSVKKGQEIARIDVGTLYSQLDQARGQAKAQKETLDNMKSNKSAFNKDQRDAQRGQVQSSQAAVDVILNQLRETILRSPMDGIVIKKNIDAGENAVANSPIVTIAQSDEMEIESNVPESDIIKIKVDQSAELVFDAFPSEEKFQARVTSIEPAATVIQDVVYYRVKFQLENPDKNFKAGMSCDIDIHTAEKKDVLAVPMRAVQTEGLPAGQAGTQKFVEVLVDELNNVVEKKKIETGLEGDEGMIEVKSGLDGSEKVVTFTKTI